MKPPPKPGDVILSRAHDWVLHNSQKGYVCTRCGAQIARIRDEVGPCHPHYEAASSGFADEDGWFWAMGKWRKESKGC